MQRRLDMIEQWLVRILCTVALVFVGLAHQVPAAQNDLSPAALAQYVLPDGTLPMLCVTVTDDSGKEHGKIAHLNPCEACRIGAAVVLPQPADVTGARIGFAVAVVLPRRAEAFHRQLFPPNTGPRAPPATPSLA
ncbi:hypothetical protein FHX15_000861 [Rhizobium sp. BK650]|uniref:hypothetical protein n=1 Tax=Rhizobium sp. BK650 TaxID=2586990 RepID=UPI00161078CE|nr:hypothetical protein [Rhizobium sp. BK650]MBB3655662.1 hypothetical protein [Rhizobium sp. BK650]